VEDVVVDAMNHVPFSGAEGYAVNGFFNPIIEPYRECLSSALEVADAQVVLTGIGGDELMGLRSYEREEGSAPAVSSLAESEICTSYLHELLRAGKSATMPVSVLYEPTLQAAAVRAPVFLDQGTWPVNPLASPDLVRFCEWLPASWRRGRKLHRDRLIRAGLGPQWPYPSLRENFTDVMAAGITTYVLPQIRKLMVNSRLADLSLINPQAVNELSERSSPRELAKTGLYELVSLELALRGLDK
jgi:asparagine synthase (glutamine-hydrolysing)